ncbi:MAG: DUF3592 domain-containing protein [Bacteroidetes bacterium]|nr:DUF3592 domain-containing protein [Bacteroidota bacterium]
MNKKSIYFTLVKRLLLGVAIILASVWFLLYQTGNPYHEYLLITQSNKAKGQITYSEENSDVVEQYDRYSREVFDVYYEYNFKTPDGIEIKDKGVQTEPKPGFLQNAKKEPIVIEVEYVPSNPKINRIVGMNSQATTIKEFIFRRFGLGLILLILFSSIGFVIISNAVKDFKTQNK